MNPIEKFLLSLTGLADQGELSRGQAGSPTGGMLGMLLHPGLTPGGGGGFEQGKGDRFTDAPTDRINQNYQANRGQAQPDPWAGMREAAPQPDPMQTASAAAPQAQMAPGADPYLAWQRGMGSSDDAPMPGQGRPMAGAGGNQAMAGGSGQDRLQGAPQGEGGGIGGLLGQLFNPGGQGRNRTVQWLTEQGMDPGTATVVASDRDMLRSFIGSRMKGADPKNALELEKLQLEIEEKRNPTTDDIREFQKAKADGYAGTFMDWQTKGVRDADKSFSQEQGLRKEYSGLPEYKRFDDVRASYDRVRASAKRGTGVGDLGLIFGYMKMLDPGSVVREGEFANAQNSAGVPEQLRNLYNRVIDGERLTPSQRKEFVGTAGDLYQAEADRIGALNKRYSDIAGQYGIDPSRIVVQPNQYDPLDLPGEVQTRGAPQSVPTPQTQQDYDALPSGTIYVDPDDGKTYRKP